jgi:hypothetical protein
MSRTKVKQNLIDASFGNILEQIVYIADGSTVSTSKGDIIVPNITARTDVSTTVVDWGGSNISYTPPDNTSVVLYEMSGSYGYWTGVGGSGFQAPCIAVNLDGTDILNSRFTPELAYGYDYEGRLHIEYPIRITGASDNLANGTVASWSSARTIKTTVASYSTGYTFAINHTYHYRGSGGNNTLIVKPFVKITAYS